MTRINVIPVSELTTQHLRAEHYELPRVFRLVRGCVWRGESPSDPRNPDAYTLGAGHVRFFYPRLGYLVYRQSALYLELIKRKVEPEEPKYNSYGIPAEWMGSYVPTAEAMELNRKRIKERLEYNYE